MDDKPEFSPSVVEYINTPKERRLKAAEAAMSKPRTKADFRRIMEIQDVIRGPAQSPVDIPEPGETDDPNYNYTQDQLQEIWERDIAKLLVDRAEPLDMDAPGLTRYQKTSTQEVLPMEAQDEMEYLQALDRTGDLSAKQADRLMALKAIAYMNTRRVR
jgi:hypothetical protein